MARKRISNKDDPAAKGELVSRSASVLPPGYATLLEDLKGRVRTAQLKAALSVNHELIRLYWDIGRLIVERQGQEGWGTSVIQRLADDVQKAFPGLRGFSRTNIFRMRAFYLSCTKEFTIVPQGVGRSGETVVPQLVGQLDGKSVPQALADIPWGHNVILLEKLKDPQERLWYAGSAREHGWSRAILTAQIESDLYHRQGKAVSNFAATLPPPQSDLARQALKDPYLFDFLTLGDEAHERDLEQGLVDHVQKFLLELGVGFAFVGRQVHLEVDGEDFYLDLLFYHLRLRCFVAIDLKMQAFEPGDAGRMNFYLSAVDAQLRHPNDQPSIGLILCKTNRRVVAEYALRDVVKPIGVAEWQTRLVQSLPEPLQGSLPTIAEIEAELE